MVTPSVLCGTGLAFFALVVFGQQLAPLTTAALGLSLAPLTTAALGVTPLFLAVLVGAAQNIMSKSCKYSLFDPCKEMAYIPLDAEARLKGKAAIDVIGNPIGKSGGAIVQQVPRPSPPPPARRPAARPAPAPPRPARQPRRRR
eukprot:tig00000113_g5669.t1